MKAFETKPQEAEIRSNRAVWLAKGGKFEIKAAPYTSPQAKEIVVRNKAVAINPIDWIMQSVGDLGFTWIKYPFIEGSDVAGEVLEVGPEVIRFKVGDRVLAHAAGADKKRNSSAEGAFQEYTVILENLAAPIPDTMAYENAVVLPLGLSTAACGLFQKDQLGLQHPTATPKPTGETLLIWGGSTSVGSNAIQLAVAAGYDVVTTASPKNFDYVKKLGASQAFDYKSRAVVADISNALKGCRMAGALAVGTGSAQYCLDILHACKGTKFISMASPSVSFADAPTPRTMSWLIPTVVRMMSGGILLMTKAALWGIKTNFIFGTTLWENEVGKLIYEDFLPPALADGRFVAAPEPLVMGKGIDSIPAAVEAQKKGVSARKIVVLL